MSAAKETTANVLMHLLRVALGTPTATAVTIHSGLWPQVYRLSARQGVAAIAWDGLQRLASEGAISPEQAPDRATKLQWALAAERTKEQYLKHRRTIVRLATIYTEADIKMMILKGFGLSLLYPTPEHRSCSDIDIWLFGEQERADELLRRRLNIKIDEDKHHHTVFYLDGVMVENHYDFLNIHAHLSNRDIEEQLRERAEHPDIVEFEGCTIYVPNADCHALFLLRHAAAHFAAAEIVLRHVTDWAMFVKHNHAKIDWVWLRDVARHHNMDRFLDAMNVISSELCNIDLALMPDTVRRPELERRILGDILSPEFDETMPERGLLRIVWFKYRRWWANRWKHRLVYREGLISTFLVQLRSHLIKPKSITHK